MAQSARLLRRKGYTATSVTEILNAAGATNGSLYHHFPGGKEDLARATVQGAGEQILRYVQHLLDTSDDVAAAAQAWIDAMIAALRADPRDGCPIAPAAIESAGISEPLRSVAADAFAAWEEAFAAALARDRPLATARAQAGLLLSALEGAQLLDRTGRQCGHLLALREAVPALVARP
ncbi:putative HTH-type transcriptional regulator YxaF [Paraconexibacter sp. AEG42_29]|uniref:HTH-type transcriptional regulator YxaF n=1 Tax=Paraconexibacter sp. AEG42_29 TaxID=2997339 RepID=A0AAU7AU87_9ACTN